MVPVEPWLEFVVTEGVGVLGAPVGVTGLDGVE
jgi:hypothetical protein